MGRFHPTEPKVVASTGAASVGTGFLLWLLGVTLFGGSPAAGSAMDAIAAVPAPVSLFVAAGVTFAAGWLAPHVERYRPEHAAPDGG